MMQTLKICLLWIDFSSCAESSFPPPWFWAIGGGYHFHIFNFSLIFAGSCQYAQPTFCKVLIQPPNSQRKVLDDIVKEEGG